MSRDNSQTRSHYPHFLSISTRWMDNDIYGHVNNVTYYSYFDTTANDYLMRYGNFDIHQSDIVGYVVASSCEYHQPIAFPETIKVGLRVNRLGNSSVEYGLAIFKHEIDSPAAIGAFTHVFVNRLSQKPVPIPSEIRTALERIKCNAS